MTAGIHADLTADGTRIVIAASGDSWEVDRAATALHKVTMLPEPFTPKNGLMHVPATWASAVQLAYTFNSDTVGRWLPRPRLQAWIREEFARRHNPAAPLTIKVPDGLVPRPYQLDAARAIGAVGKFLLFDDPGVGKTLSAILGLMNRHNLGHIFPLLIVVPSWDVGDVWVREIRKWAPDWPEPVLYGGPGRFLGPDILITTYATMRLDASDMSAPLVKLKAAAVVADEVHLAKNPHSKQSQALKRVCARAGTVIGLTGTPITRDTGDIYPVLEAMDPDSWPSRKRFVQRYCDTSDNGYGEVVEGLKVLAEPEFRSVTAGQYRRVAKGDVLSQLPPKVYSVRRVEIPAEWRKAYDTMQDQMLAELPDGGELPVMTVLAQLTRLGQLASSACDVAVTHDLDMETGELRPHYEVTLKAPSWKADALVGVLGERPGQQAAVFAVSRSSWPWSPRILCIKLVTATGWWSAGRARSPGSRTSTRSSGAS